MRIRKLTYGYVLVKMVDKTIFRAYDVRGIYGQNLTDETFSKIGYILGGKMKFVVGGDIRASSPALAKALIAGLQSKGAEIIYIGAASFGQTLFAGRHFKSDRTLFVTASHLPPEWNGLKIYYGDGISFNEHELKELGDKVAEIELPKLNEVQLNAVDIKKEYSDFMHKSFKVAKKLKVVLDCGSGATCLSAPELFKRFGHEVIEMNCVPDASFPNRPAEPNPENIQDLVKKVVEVGADIGIAFDGDGDRSAVVCHNGKVLTGNELGVIIGSKLLKNNRGAKVVRTVSCSMLIDTEFAEHLAQFIMTPVGHTYVGNSVKTEGAVIGIEESGHIFMPQYAYYDDALFVPLKIIELMSQAGKSVHELASEHPIYPFEEIVHKCPDNLKFSVVERVKERASKKHSNLNTIDGVKVTFEDGWALIRAANTSPKIRLYVEAKTQARFEEIKSEFSQMLVEELASEAL